MGLADIRPADDPVLARLDAIEARLLKLEADRRPQRDAAADVRLLGAVALAFGARVWSVRDLRRQHDAELGAVIRGVSARRLGKWIEGMCDRPIGPYTVRRVKRDARGVLWCLSVSADHHTQTRPEDR